MVARLTEPRRTNRIIISFGKATGVLVEHVPAAKRRHLYPVLIKLWKDGPLSPALGFWGLWGFLWFLWVCVLILCQICSCFSINPLAAAECCLLSIGQLRELQHSLTHHESFRGIMSHDHPESDISVNHRWRKSHNISNSGLNSPLFHFLSTLKHEFSIIALTETWLSDESVELYNMPQYTLVFSNRKERVGGGVAVFVHNQYRIKVRKDLDLISNETEVESVFLELMSWYLLSRQNSTHV